MPENYMEPAFESKTIQPEYYAGKGAGSESHAVTFFAGIQKKQLPSVLRRGFFRV
jgi:hypothetical protein